MRIATALLVLVVGCGGGSHASSTGGDGGAGDDEGGALDGGECPTSVQASPGLVLTDRGIVQGTQANGTWAYQGIPYAAPPVGPLRWSAPQAHACWSSTLAATSFGSICMQVSSSNQVTGQEDCLTANVWVPSGQKSGSPPLPVLVFIHGGGNVQGSSADTDSAGDYLYDGALLAAKENAVVVTFNYRLNVFGFLAHPAFGANPGNYGTLDQIFLLGWVQRNAAAFGGDPTHVLLFGQSAGAEDVCNMVASPLAKGLLSAALMESGGCLAESLSDAESFAHTWATMASCDSTADPAACMRALDASAVEMIKPETASIAGDVQGDYRPDVDGVALTGSSDQVIASGAHNHVPFVIGSNSDETSLELGKDYPGGLTVAQYQSAVLNYAGSDQTLANQILAEYPASSYATPLEAYVQVTTDAKFTSGARYAARVAAMGQTDKPVWRYFYTHHLDDGSSTEQALGAWHGQELVFVFVDLYGYVPSAGEQMLGTFIDDAWTGMSANGSPGAMWPTYVASTDPYLQLDDTVQAGTGVRTDLCDFWDMVLGRP